MLIGKSSVDCSISCMWVGAGVQVVARVPFAGPVPPPIRVVTPAQIQLSAPNVKDMVLELICITRKQSLGP